MRTPSRHRGADPEDARSFGAARLPALRQALHDLCWLLDEPVDNSGRLKDILQQVGAESGWSWEVDLVLNPDRVLSGTDHIVCTADHVVLDRCQRWFNLARRVVAQHAPNARLIHLDTADSSID